MILRTNSDKVETYDRTEDGVHSACENALAGEPVDFGGSHHVIETPLGQLSVSRKAGGLESPPNIFIGFDLRDSHDMTAEERAEHIESHPALQDVLETLAKELLPWGDVTPELQFADDNYRAYCRIGV